MKSFVVTATVTVLILIALTALFWTWSFMTVNRAIAIEEQVSSAVANIESSQQRRLDVIGQLVQVAEQLAGHEKSVIKSITEARAALKDSNAEKALSSIQVAVEAYPQLVADKGYIHLMQEISISENQIKQSRDNYNSAVRYYNRFVRQFPSGWFLSFRGYEIHSYLYFKGTEESKQPVKEMFKDTK